MKFDKTYHMVVNVSLQLWLVVLMFAGIHLLTLIFWPDPVTSDDDAYFQVLHYKNL